MRVRTVFLTVAILASFEATAQAPTPVVERVSTHLGRTTRVSLFTNHVIAVSIRSDTEDYVHQATLDYGEYMVYLQALNLAAEDIDEEPVASDIESRDSTTVLIIHVGPDAPRVFRFSPLSSLSLPVSKITSVMDDLQTRALAALPGEFEIMQWQPEVGDCVELRQGGEGCVMAISEDGTIVLQREDIVMTYTVAKVNRSEVILRIIEPSP